MNKKKIVLSGINLFEGGPLKIYYECLDEIVNKKIYKEYDIVLFVHKKELFTKYYKYFLIYELPRSRNNYLHRLYYEYFYFYKFSKKHKIDIWISLHDITPRVIASSLVTYCHNPTFNYKSNISDLFKNTGLFLSSKFYKYIYKINIKKNKYVVVQQDWIAKEFKRLFHLNNIIVFPPEKLLAKTDDNGSNNINEFIFFYPALPRSFKNFEIICEAVEKLKNNNIDNFQVILTIDGSENKYSKALFLRYNYLKNIKFIGKQSKNIIDNIYINSTALIFPSKLETWGLPITEAKEFHLPIIVSNLPYAHETVGIYDRVIFFDSSNSNELCDIIKKILTGKIDYQSHEYTITNKYVAHNWEDILNMCSNYNKNRNYHINRKGDTYE